MKAPKLKNKKLEDGNEVISESTYMQPSMPKSFRVYTAPLSYKKNMYLIECSQEDLDKLVAEIGFYDDNGNMIVKAPKKNPNAPFWKHPDLKLVISNAGTTLDDENPLHKFWLLCFEADPRFRLMGEKLPPSIASRVQYTVSKVSDKLGGQSESNDEAYTAMKLLTANEDNYDKLVSILRAMGTDVRKPNPRLVRDALMRKITDFKDLYVQGTAERNIERFIRLAEASTEDLEIKSLVTKARKRGMITKNSRNEYTYGDFKLGTSLDKVEGFLGDGDNVDILNELLEKTKD